MKKNELVAAVAEKTGMTKTMKMKKSLLLKQNQ